MTKICENKKNFTEYYESYWPQKAENMARLTSLDVAIERNFESYVQWNLY